VLASYSFALLGLDHLRLEADQWVQRVGLEALSAAAAIASNEVRRVSAAEALLDEYFGASNIGGGTFPRATSAAAASLPPTPAMTATAAAAAAAAAAANGGAGAGSGGGKEQAVNSPQTPPRLNVLAFHTQAAQMLGDELQAHGFMVDSPASPLPSSSSTSASPASFSYSASNAGEGSGGGTVPGGEGGMDESFDEVAAMAALSTALVQLAPTTSTASSSVSAPAPAATAAAHHHSSGDNRRGSGRDSSGALPFLVLDDFDNDKDCDDHGLATGHAMSLEKMASLEKADGVKSKLACQQQEREFVVVLKVRALETIRCAVARAARLRSTAVAAAAEATAGCRQQQADKNAATTTNSMMGSTNNGGDGGGGPMVIMADDGGGNKTVLEGISDLSQVVALRTNAEHKAVAATARRLRLQVNGGWVGGWVWVFFFFFFFCDIYF
jgi:hypothetical protein